MPVATPAPAKTLLTPTDHTLIGVRASGRKGRWDAIQVEHLVRRLAGRAFRPACVGYAAIASKRLRYVWNVP